MDKRERIRPNNQPLVVGKKEGIEVTTLPHALKLHAIPLSPLFFMHKRLSFGASNLISIWLVATPLLVLCLNR